WKNSRPASDKRYVVTAQDPFELGLVAWRISSRFDIPLQLQVHTDFLSPYFKKGSLKNRARLVLAHMLIPRAQSIRVVSERIKRSLLLKYHRITPNIHVVPIFVDIDTLRSVQAVDLRKKYPGFDRIILMASRLSSEKNIPMAIRAFREVVKKHPRTGLLIVGSGPEELRLKAYAERLDLKGKIFFGGWQSSIAPFAKAAHIFLSTSLYEGYGLSVVEAAVTGTLVVSSDVGIATELLPERCRFEPRDEEDLQWILCRAVGESRERQESLRFIRDHIQYVTYKSKEAQLKALKETFEAAVR
ncbi:MAG: glycosyltransferase, partial [Methylomonas sp.]|nr:glycosyltransferase [Methylomonas sp.]